MEVQVTHY